jgi:hypothetical protein
VSACQVMHGMFVGATAFQQSMPVNH